jgi:hypothetical protein
MNKCGRNNSFSLISAVHLYVLVCGLAAVGALFLSGCGDFFAQKPTEIESMSVLKDLQEVRENPHTENPLPDIYIQPPSRLNIAGGVKLFYFTKHHPAGDLANLVNQQLDLKIVSNPSTNQMVVYCPDEVTADKTLEYLDIVDVPPIQVNIDCLILERFGDVTMDWETSIMIENFLGEGITLGEQRGTFDSQGNLIGLDPAFPGASLREEARSTFGLLFGYWIDQGVPGHQVRTVVDILESRGYLKVLLNPTLETINGKSAKVSIQDYASYEEIQTGKGGTSDVYSITKYQWLADSLEVTPTVFADGYVGLKAEINVASRSKPEGVTQKAILTERSIKVAENRIKPGHSLIIGGMRKSEKRSVIRGVPFFKDIPLLGIFFSSKDFEEKGTEIIFILTPSISSGGRPYEEVAEEVRKKHEEIRYDPELGDVLSDPLGAGAYTDLVETQATESEVARVKAEMEKADAEKRVRAARDAAERANAEALKAEAEVEKIKAEAAKALADAEKAKASVAAAQKQTEAEKAKAAQALAEKQKALEQAKAAADAAEQAKTQAQQALEKAKQEQVKTQQSLEQTQKANEEAQKAKAETAEALKAKAEAEAAKAAAEKAKAEAEAAKAAEEAQKNEEPIPENTPDAESDTSEPQDTPEQTDTQ